MTVQRTTGDRGEALAAEFLTNRGYRIVEKNFRFNHAEIDLIAKKEKLLVFVEVKTRSGTGFGFPEDFVNATKVRLVRKAAAFYIFSRDWHFDVRFDVVSILEYPDGRYEIRHLEDAFY